jgi:aminoglycoside 3-N-acetyltransferase
MGWIERLGESWRSCGIEAGDTVLIHSNVKRMLAECRKSELTAQPKDLLDSFLSAVGASGTVLLPLFNFQFTTGVAFDIRTTPSEMGALTEVGRLHPAAVRTGHPIYSFAAIGAGAADFAGIDNVSGYAEDSPFGILRRRDGKIAVLDLEDQNSMTFYHHVEEIKRVPYRYFKSFRGDYTDFGGLRKVKEYQLFVRDMARGVLTDVNPAGEVLWSKGFYNGYRPGEGVGLRVVRSRDMFNVVSDIIDSGRALGTLYSVDSAVAG